jgi:hypothetical protein
MISKDITDISYRFVSDSIQGSVLASKSVLLQDTEENCMYAGAPAAKIKEVNN